MSEILIGEYLFRRLKEIGIETVFGVPGDYELGLLDLVEPQGLSWVGTPNELVGAYAADGYARLKGAAALVTTFGPGELSALCGIGGSFCEFVPVLHIVGYPTTAAQKSGRILHHTLGDGNYDHYVNISANFSCATAVLKDPINAAAEIDRVVEAMLLHSKPAYIGISEDVAYSKVSVSRLDQQIARSIPPSISSETGEDRAVEAIVGLLKSSKAPVLMVDGGAARPSWSKHIDPFVEALRIPFFVTALGKGTADESSPFYSGCYAGTGSCPQEVAEAVSEADCILWLGNYPSDFNTGMFSEHVENSTIVDFQRFTIKIGEDTQYKASINHVLPKLITALNSLSLQLPQLKVRHPSQPSSSMTTGKDSTTPDAIEQDWLWSRLSNFLMPGDLVVTETGTAQVGITATRFPSGCRGWSQVVYGSIGYAVAAAAGAAFAAAELRSQSKSPDNDNTPIKRVVLITGEGSLQLTVQAMSLLARQQGDVRVVILVVNNNGYTVERFFRGMHAKYNDVALWDYPTMFMAFAGPPGVFTPAVRGCRVERKLELDAVLLKENAGAIPGLARDNEGPLVSFHSLGHG